MSHFHNCYVCSEDFPCDVEDEKCDFTSDDDVLCDDCAALEDFGSEDEEDEDEEIM